VSKDENTPENSSDYINNNFTGIIGIISRYKKCSGKNRNRRNRVHRRNDNLSLELAARKPWAGAGNDKYAQRDVDECGWDRYTADSSAARRVSIDRLVEYTKRIRRYALYSEHCGNCKQECIREMGIHGGGDTAARSDDSYGTDDSTNNTADDSTNDATNNTANDAADDATNNTAIEAADDPDDANSGAWDKSDKSDKSDAADGSANRAD